MLQKKRIILEFLRKRWMIFTLFLVLGLPFLIGLSLLVRSFPLFETNSIWDVLFSSDWSPNKGKFGLWPFIANSVMISLFGLVLMIPMCLSSAIYITQFAPNWLANSLRSMIDILAGIPSVIYGLWGVLTIVPIIGNFAEKWGYENTSGFSVLAGSIVAAISVMPFVLNMLIELFESVTQELKETSLSMGYSYWEMIRKVLLKKFRPGIIASFTLGISKAFGETIAILMVVGNVVQLPGNLFDAGYPLSALLANNYGEMMSIPMYESALMFSAFILLVVVIIFNYLAHKIIRHYQSKI